ncbi:hypothetical protein [Effusibacillus dendaii]|uniref:Uncharacterized protein n=1 Tax=Effusibacillus dendaii TaxID=2743772 RepID=A0A7I8D604_9BACL|nr:hypothetical protein [Effusibacillus dendaii]BCJ85564.1 hypothetical protein skT53_05490 [Effusibacillus dendaii]
MILRQLQTIVSKTNRKNLGWYQISLSDKNTASDLVNSLRSSGYEVRIETESAEWKIRFKR